MGSLLISPWRPVYWTTGRAGHNTAQKPIRRGSAAGWASPGVTSHVVTALEAWLEAAGISEGAVYRRVFNRRAQRVGDQRLAARNVASVVKLRRQLGFDPATFGGHSLRSG